MLRNEASIISLFILLFGFKVPNAQTNLVLNPSFEELENCNLIQIPDRLVVLDDWFNPTNQTPDIFSECSPENHAGVPYNPYGYQQAYHDSSFAGIIAYHNLTVDNNLRDYITGKLDDFLSYLLQHRSYTPNRI